MSKGTHWKKRLLPSIALCVAFLTAGWLLMSWVEGWGGIALWILVALPLCVALEFELRRREIRKAPKRSVLGTGVLRVDLSNPGPKPRPERKASDELRSRHDKPDRPNSASQRL